MHGGVADSEMGTPAVFSLSKKSHIVDIMDVIMRELRAVQ
jgi:hypothetical protein